MEAKEKADLLMGLLQNEEFLGRFNDVEEDISQTKELFASEGLDLSDDQLEVVISALRSAKKSMYTGEPLDDDDTENVSGGGIIESSIRKLLALAILSGTLYGGYQVYTRVKEKGGVQNEDVQNLVRKGRNAGEKVINLAKNAINEGAEQIALFLATPKKHKE